MQTGENQQALHKNLEFLRFFSIAILLVHYYCTCYPAMVTWGLVNATAVTLLFKLSRGLVFLSGITLPKLSVLLLLGISQMGERGKKDTNLLLRPILVCIGAGVAVFLLSIYLLNLPAEPTTVAIAYMTTTSIGYLFIMFGGARLSRLIQVKLGKDPFNLLEETFPQEERLLENEYSVNLPAQYNLKGKIRKSWINIINPFRALLVLGTPGGDRVIFH